MNTPINTRIYQDTTALELAIMMKHKLRGLRTHGHDYLIHADEIDAVNIVNLRNKEVLQVTFTEGDFAAFDLNGELIESEELLPGGDAENAVAGMALWVLRA